MMNLKKLTACLRRQPLWGLVLAWILFSSCAANHNTAQPAHIPPDKSVRHPGSTVSETPLTPSAAKRKTIVQNAVNTIGSPYKWGGTSPAKGLDCSGLVVYSHRRAGIQVPRTAKDQMTKGRPVFKQNLQPADLVFFSTARKSKSIHVGLYVGDGLFLHSPGKGRNVTWASLDNPYFKSRFIGARTYIFSKI